MATLEDITRWQPLAKKFGSTTLDTIIELVSAIEAVGEYTRSWPREIRLDGTEQTLEAAADKGTQVIKAILGEE